jgi:hypothetical protein
MENAHDVEDAIMAYREEVGKTIAAYREEVGEIIQQIPRKIFARLVDLTPTAREAVLSAICNGRTFSRSWRTTPTVEHRNLKAKVDWPRDYIEELETVLAEVERAGRPAA